MIQMTSVEPPSPTPFWHAISIKQPWAALIAAGIKTIEVRTWPSNRRGPLLIHAAKVPDPRPEAWAWITTPELEQATKLLGGIVAQAELVGCKDYDTVQQFVADSSLHLNAEQWFQEKGLHGLVFRKVKPVPFHRFPGNTFFFPVKTFTLSQQDVRPTRLDDER